jgi:hypothetical protein
MKTLAELIAIITLALFQTNCGSEEQTEEATNIGSTAYPSGYSQAADSTVRLNFQGAQGLAALAVAPQTIAVNAPGGTAAGSLELTKALIVLDKIKIKMEATGTTTVLTEGETSTETEIEDDSLEDESSELEFEFAGPFLVDLLTNTVTPDPGQLDLPAGNYKEIVLSMHKVEDSDAEILGITTADPLFANSMLIEGSFTPESGSTVKLNMSYEFGEEFKIRGSKGVDISSDTVNEMVIAFRLDRWFEFDNAETNSDGADLTSLATGDIAIDKDSDDAAKDIREVIKENVKVSADFGKDEDGDGELSNDEDAEDDSEEDDVEEPESDAL